MVAKGLALGWVNRRCEGLTEPDDSVTRRCVKGPVGLDGRERAGNPGNPSNAGAGGLVGGGKERNVGAGADSTDGGGAARGPAWMTLDPDKGAKT